MNVAATVDRVADYWNRDLNPELHDDIVGAGPRATPSLVRLLSNPGYAMGRVHEHALTLLGEIRDSRALPHIIPFLREERNDLDFHSMDIVVAFGELAVAPLLRVVRTAPEWYADAVVECANGKRLPGVGEMLRDLLEVNPEQAAIGIRKQGDPALIPDLMATIHAVRSGRRPCPDRALALAELIEAVRSFGVEPLLPG